MTNLLPGRAPSPYLQLLLFIFVIVVAGILAFSLLMMLAIAFWGMSDVMNMMNADSSHLEYLQYIQIASQLSILVLPPLIYARFFERDANDFLKLRSPRRGHLLLAFLAILTCAPFVGWLVTVNEMMLLPEGLKPVEDWMRASEDRAMEITENFLSVTSVSGLLVNIVMMAMLPALGEELLMRGGFLTLFNRIFKGRYHIAVILSAFIFSAIHLQFYGFLPRFALGLILGYLFVWSGSIWVPILAHFVNNLIVVLVAYAHARGQISTPPEEFGVTTSVWLIAGSALLLFFFMRGIYISRAKQVGEEL